MTDTPEPIQIPDDVARAICAELEADTPDPVQIPDEVARRKAWLGELSARFDQGTCELEADHWLTFVAGADAACAALQASASQPAQGPVGHANRFRGMWNFDLYADKMPDTDEPVPLYATPPAYTARQDRIMEIVKFLDGEAPLDGVWFGDPHPIEKGLYWWRKHMRAALEREVRKP